MLNSSILASLHPGLLGLWWPSSWAVTMAEAAAARPVERDAANSHGESPSVNAKAKKDASIIKCTIPWAQRSATKGVPEARGGLATLDCPIATSRIGPMTQMKTTPSNV